MSSDPNLALMVTVLRNEWEQLVRCALKTPSEKITDVATVLSQNAGVGLDSMKRKINAIQAQVALGYTEDEIVSMGQENVLGAHIKQRKQANYENQVTMKWLVSGSQRELVQQMQRRMMNVLKLDTPIQWWDFMLSYFGNHTDEQLAATIAEEEPGVENRD